MRRLAGLVGIPLLITLNSCNLMQDCPSEEHIRKTLKDKIPESAKVVSIKRVDGVKGMCEVVLKDGMSVAVIYTNKDVSRVFVGHLYETKNHQSLTLKSIKENTKLTKDEVSKLDSLVNMELGVGDRFVYYITAPNCNACKLFEDILLPWAKEKKVKVKVILAPNPLDFKSFDTAVSLLCDKKSLEDMRKGYTSENLCEDGRRLIDNNVKFLYQELKLPGVPHIVGPTGQVISQIPTKGMLDDLIK